MLVFLDTEFTTFHDPKLISIGLAAATGETFYAEVPFDYESSSEFVREIVVPLLHVTPTDLCDMHELRQKIGTWLSLVKLNDDIEICFDAEYDWSLFSGVFENCPPTFCKPRNVGYEISELLRYDFHKMSHRPEHHALNDAEALRYAFRPRISST